MLHTIQSQIDECRMWIQHGQGQPASFYRFCRALNWLRAMASPEQWAKAADELRASPLGRMCHEDPYTLRAFQKPRRFAGDAEMLEYVYTGQSGAPITDAGARVFAGTTAGPTGWAVVSRAQYAGGMLDDLPIGSVALNVACGHLREADSSVQAQTGRIHLTGVDQDPMALAVAADRYPHHRLEAMRVKDIIAGKADRPGMRPDLTYSLGLFDYLNDETAAQLIDRLLDWTRPGGRVVVATVVPWAEGLGYMSALMAWELPGARGPHQLMALSPTSLCRTWLDGEVAWLEVIKA